MAERTATGRARAGCRDRGGGGASRQLERLDGPIERVANLGFAVAILAPPPSPVELALVEANDRGRGSRQRAACGGHPRRHRCRGWWAESFEDRVDLHAAIIVRPSTSLLRSAGPPRAPQRRAPFPPSRGSFPPVRSASAAIARRTWCAARSRAASGSRAVARCASTASARAATPSPVVAVVSMNRRRLALNAAAGGRKHRAELARGAIRSGPVGLVDDYQVRDLEQPGLDGLDLIPHLGDLDDDGRLGEPRDLDLRLPGTHRLDQDGRSRRRRARPRRSRSWPPGHRARRARPSSGRTRRGPRRVPSSGPDHRESRRACTATRVDRQDAERRPRRAPLPDQAHSRAWTCRSPAAR